MAESDKPVFAKMYADGMTPWHTGKPCPELVAVLDAGLFPGKRALDMGCGFGSNALEFARRGFEVTAVDYVEQALETARERAQQAGLQGKTLKFQLADMTANPKLDGPYDVLYDRGAYHSIRRVDLAGFLKTIENNSRPGTRWLCLAGNSKQKLEFGPPTVSEAEFRAELGGLFNFLAVKEITFETYKEDFRPAGWHILMERK